MYSGEFKSNRFWCVSVALYHGIQNHVFCPHLEMVPNMLFWHETSSKVEKSWKMDFWKFFKIFPLSPRHFGVFLVKKSKIWNFAGNGPKHFVLTWNEFWSWKKLKNREYQISLAREREDFITIQNRRIVTTTVTQTFRRTFHDVMFTALETVVTFCAINVILQGKDILCIKIGNILNNLTHEYSLSIEHDVILKIEHVFEWWKKKEKWIMPGFLFLWFSVSLGNYSLYILGLAEFQDNRVFQKMHSAIQNIN